MGESARAKDAPLVYNHIVENVSIVSMCQNCKVTYKLQFLAYVCLAKGCIMMNSDMRDKVLRSSLEFCLFPIAEW